MTVAVPPPSAVPLFIVSQASLAKLTAPAGARTIARPPGSWRTTVTSVPRGSVVVT